MSNTTPQQPRSAAPNKEEQQPRSATPTQATKEKKDPSFTLPVWIIKKALHENLSIEQLITYWWIYRHNAIARVRHHDQSLVFGKRTYDAIHMLIKTEFGIGRPDNTCSKLEEKGWIKKTFARAFNDTRQVGYLCLLVESDRRMAQAQQQQLNLDDEAAVITVESSLPSTGEYTQFGIRYYDTPDGTQHQLPSSAPPRPTNTAIWCNDPEGWYEPEDLPTHDLEY